LNGAAAQPPRCREGRAPVEGRHHHPRRRAAIAVKDLPLTGSSWTAGVGLRSLPVPSRPEALAPSHIGTYDGTGAAARIKAKPPLIAGDCSTIISSFPFLTMNPPTIPLGVPFKDSFSIVNTKKVLDAVSQRFPDWADQCEPYVNVLTLKAWNQRGYRVRKGEKAIRVATLLPVWKEDEKTGEKAQIGTRPGTAFVFALPQVEKRQ
jgi:hypothetical protein